MFTEQPVCRICGGGLNSKVYTGFEVKNDQWLEEMGDMISAAVEGMRKAPSFSACCHERQTRDKYLYS
jgi:hypothetical protein